MENFLPGDLLKTHGTGGFGIGNHYGVKVNDGSVVHLTGQDKQYARPHITSLAEFANGRAVEVVPVNPRRFTQEQIVARAYDTFYKWPQDYSIPFSNCEHFARFIATGVSESTQVQACAVVLGLAVAVAFAGMKPARVAVSRKSTKLGRLYQRVKTAARKHGQRIRRKHRRSGGYVRRRKTLRAYGKKARKLLAVGGYNKKKMGKWAKLLLSPKPKPTRPKKASPKKKKRKKGRGR